MEVWYVLIPPWLRRKMRGNREKLNAAMSTLVFDAARQPAQAIEDGGQG
ncbi:MAG: hypothetical protein WBR56_15225 [Sedimenticolaceae bacterium]